MAMNDNTILLKKILKTLNEIKAELEKMNK